MLIFTFYGRHLKRTVFTFFQDDFSAFTPPATGNHPKHFQAVRVMSPALGATSNGTVCMRAIHETQPCGHTSTDQTAR
jgi:hypothetical protein